MLFQSCKLCVYIPSPLLTFVNAANEDVAVGRFKVPAINATRKMGRKLNWFSRNHPAG